MGFSHQHAFEALLHSNNNFDAATEYLLTTPAPVVPTSTSSGAGASANTGASATTAAAAPTSNNEV